MTEATQASLSKFIPWIVAVLVAIGSAVMTLEYSEDRIERLEAWQVSHIEHQHPETERNVALVESRVRALEDSSARTEEAVAEIRDDVSGIKVVAEALCNTSPQCRSILR
jgi:predicted DNA repair protein MutK